MVGEGLLTAIIGSIGLGAVALTRFGTRPYPAYNRVVEAPVKEDPDKVTAVLETLPVEDATDLKDT
jgi:hypothetical protein